MSACNPACPADQHCVNGECEPLPRIGEPVRYRYFALLGGVRSGLNQAAATFGEIKLDIGGRYVAFQLAGGFGDHITSIGGQVLGHIFFQPWSAHPFFIVPRLGLGYTYSWVDDLDKTSVQEFFLTPSLRLRYDFKNRVSVFVDPLALGITFLQLASSDRQSLQRTSEVPVHLGVSIGVALLY